MLQDFFQQRLRFVLQERGLRYDTVEAALATAGDDINRTVKRARVLSERRNEESFIPYVQAYTRCLNLTKKEAPQVLDPSLLVDATEIALENAISLRIAAF